MELSQTFIGEAANGMGAIEYVKRQKPDVMLVDLIMDGIEAIQRILVIHPDLRIIAMTDLAGEDQLISAFQAGAVGFLPKDTQPDELVDAIRTVSKDEPSTIEPESRVIFFHL